ncbi:hypothetical protein DSO57_1008378 [Entomophthora muscae]|uniref:Uncharacterized protein n=1 Tax=Entomophthora muscae TaxID=34485 RepID=A0ACC2RYB6_9FUNG|nr:hypothetical protein DSO57_1008378 [Entomophthora muscae]
MHVSKEQSESPAEECGIRRALLCMGLVVMASMSGLDETIVSTALSSISEEFHEAGEVTWIATAYLITMTSFQPLYGKLADIFGRRIVMIVAMVLFIGGSMGCGMAGSSGVLSMFRGVAGMGAGGMVSLGFIILSDLAPLSQRSLYLSMLNVTFGISNMIGPLAGGLIVDKVGWRWVFIINVPIGLVGLGTLYFTLPSHCNDQCMGEQLRRVDVAGALLLVLSIILIVLGVNWGGKDYAWDSWQVVVCLCLGVVILVAFFVVEEKAIEPILPWRIFNRNLLLCNVVTLVNGLCMFSFMYYWPLFHMTFHQHSATRAGLEVLPILLSDGLLSALSGVITHRSGTYRWMMRLGMVLILAGASLLAFLPHPIPRALELILPLMVGIGIGLNTQNSLIATQASAPSEIAIVTSFNAFANSMGGVLGLALLGAVFDNTLSDKLRSALPDPHQASQIAISLKRFHALDPESHLRAASAYAEAYQTLFITLVPFAIVGCIATFAMDHVPLQCTTLHSTSSVTLANASPAHQKSTLMHL